MLTDFTPHLSILLPPQLRLWDELHATPKKFILYGGTALALHLGHRDSIDFDFSSNTLFEGDEILALPFLKNAVVLERAPNTLTVRVDREGAIKLSFFGVPKLKRLKPPHIATDNGIHIASLLDIAGTKAAVVQKRAEAKDYIDIAALLESGMALDTMLAAGSAIYGTNFNPEITLKALCYFEDAGVCDLPEATKKKLITAVKAVDLDTLPVIIPEYSQ